MPPPAELDDIAELAAALAGDAGELLLERLLEARSDVGTKTSGTDMVTEMDRAAEELIVSRLRERRPDDGILAEEGSERDGTTGVRWIVDPLDGTTNYLYGLPAFAVSVAVEVDGEVMAAAVNDPSHRETFSAVKGRGAACNGRPLHVRESADSVATALVATGFAYAAERRGWQGEVAARVLSEVRDVRRSGAASLDLCWVGAGRLDVYWERWLQPWDVAAGILVASEAGAWVGDLDGDTPSADLTIAAAPHLAEPFRALLRRAEADVGSG
jgi:myo-inositol-1(or 4)-monophosphatase